MKNFGEKEAWAYPGTAQFLRVPLVLRNGESYIFQSLHAHLWAQSEQKPIKNSGKVYAWALSGTPENFPGAHT